MNHGDGFRKQNPRSHICGENHDIEVAAVEGKNEILPQYPSDCPTHRYNTYSEAGSVLFEIRALIGKYEERNLHIFRMGFIEPIEKIQQEPLVAPNLTLPKVRALEGYTDQERPTR